MFSSNQTQLFQGCPNLFSFIASTNSWSKGAWVSFAMLLHVCGVDARWLKLVRKTDERIVISSCQTVRNTKTISTVIKIMKKKNLSSFAAKIVPEMSGSLGFQSSKRRPFHFQKSFHFIDMGRLRCIIFQACLLFYIWWGFQPHF